MHATTQAVDAKQLFTQTRNHVFFHHNNFVRQFYEKARNYKAVSRIIILKLLLLKDIIKINEKILNFFYPDGSKLADINLAIVDKRLEFKNIKLYNDKGVEVTYEEFAGLDTKTCKVLSVNFSYESENASVYCDIFYEESGIKNKTFRKEFKSK